MAVITQNKQMLYFYRHSKKSIKELVKTSKDSKSACKQNNIN